MNYTSPRAARSPSLARLPPLTALRAFVVAAKYSSFVRAAEELHVTPAAIGQQIRQLEAHLGCSLFERNGRALRLTDDGNAVLPGLSEGFERIIEALARLAAAESSGLLTVSVTPWMPSMNGGPKPLPVLRPPQAVWRSRRPLCPMLRPDRNAFTPGTMSEVPGC